MKISSLKRIFELIQKYSEELEIQMDDQSLLILIYLDKEGITPRKKLIEELNRKIAQENVRTELEKLISKNFVHETKTGGISLTEKGELAISPIYMCAYQSKIKNLPKLDIEGYELLEKRGEGATGVTYLAKTNTGKKVILKVFRPNIIPEDKLNKSIKSSTEIASDYIVTPTRHGKIKLDDLKLDYIEMEFIDGIELDEFLEKTLEKEIHYNVESLIKNFILEVGRTLEILEKKNLEHGDLHPSNILVIEDDIREFTYHFKIVDFIGLKTKEELKKYELSDVEYFKENIELIISVSRLAQMSGKMSLERMLGDKLFGIYSKIKNNQYNTIQDILSDFRSQPPKLETGLFEEKPEYPFGHLIFEHYDTKNPDWLKRFYPHKGFRRELKKFANNIISGPRGCGKSIYLRSLSFIPELIKKISDNKELVERYVNYKNIFGIYIAGRSADYKIFSEEFIGRKFEHPDNLVLKHIIILDIFERTCKLIGEGYEKDIFNAPSNGQKILRFLKDHLIRKPSIIGGENAFLEISKLLKGEKANIINFFGEKNKYSKVTNKLLNEQSLIDFFGLINNNVEELSDTKFYLLFDDVSDPNVPFEAQHVLNSIIRANNERYCFKVSTEKYAFEFVDYNGKNLESPHDYTYLDIPMLGKKRDDRESKKLENYLRNIVNQQLNILGIYRDIGDILEAPKFSAKEFINRLAESKRVQWGGWNIIWQLGSGSPRVILQLLESILREYGYDKIDALKGDEGDKFNLGLQHKAIMKFSKTEYANIINIGYKGGKLFNIVRVFGEISKRYLRRNIDSEDEQDRHYEILAIERTDAYEIKEDANEFLRLLVRHSVFTDDGLAFAISQIGLIRKFTLHKRFAPALSTTYRERERLKLSKDQLETFLLEPNKFLDVGTKYLGGLFKGKLQTDLPSFYEDKDEN